MKWCIHDFALNEPEEHGRENKTDSVPPLQEMLYAERERRMGSDDGAQCWLVLYLQVNCGVMWRGIVKG